MKTLVTSFKDYNGAEPNLQALAGILKLALIAIVIATFSSASWVFAQQATEATPPLAPALREKTGDGATQTPAVLSGHVHCDGSNLTGAVSGNKFTGEIDHSASQFMLTPHQQTQNFDLLKAAGESAELRSDYQQAVVFYEAALRERPGDADITRRVAINRSSLIWQADRQRMLQRDQKETQTKLLLQQPVDVLQRFGVRLPICFPCGH